MTHGIVLLGLLSLFSSVRALSDDDCRFTTPSGVRYDLTLLRGRGNYHGAEFVWTKRSDSGYDQSVYWCPCCASSRGSFSVGLEEGYSTTSTYVMLNTSSGASFWRMDDGGNAVYYAPSSPYSSRSGFTMQIIDDPSTSGIAFTADTSIYIINLTLRLDWSSWGKPRANPSDSIAINYAVYNWFTNNNCSGPPSSIVVYPVWGCMPISADQSAITIAMDKNVRQFIWQGTSCEGDFSSLGNSSTYGCVSGRISSTQTLTFKNSLPTPVHLADTVSEKYLLSTCSPESYISTTITYGSGCGDTAGHSGLCTYDSASNSYHKTVCGSGYTTYTAPNALAQDQGQGQGQGTRGGDVLTVAPSRVPGIIAGVVVGSVVGTLLITGAVVLLVLRLRKKPVEEAYVGMRK